MSSTITVPKGMSCVNAFRALWEFAETAYPIAMDPKLVESREQEVSTPQKIAQLFKDHVSFHYEGGKAIKVNFSHFPKINVAEYDLCWGKGAAKFTIKSYNDLPPNKRFDMNDSYKFKQLARKH